MMSRVKLAYPKIPDSKNSLLEKCIAFEKYDGTNLHWVWESELGWYAFGTRRDRFDLDERGIADFDAAHPGLEAAAELFIRDFAQPLATIWRSNPSYNSPTITVFTEFFGDRSFAGIHQPNEPKQLVLFDVETQLGMVEPERFVSDFSSVNIARVIYSGKLTGKFIEDVRIGKYAVSEGVVCKGKNTHGIWMVKVKTNAYMDRLKQVFQEDWENYWET
jgi:RNA ligase